MENKDWLVGRIHNPDATIVTGKPLKPGSVVFVPTTDDISKALDEVLAQMRKDGQGLSHDQEQTIRRGLGL